MVEVLDQVEIAAVLSVVRALYEVASLELQQDILSRGQLCVRKHLLKTHSSKQRNHVEFFEKFAVSVIVDFVLLPFFAVLSHATSKVAEEVKPNVLVKTKELSEPLPFQKQGRNDVFNIGLLDVLFGFN